MILVEDGKFSLEGHFLDVTKDILVTLDGINSFLNHDDRLNKDDREFIYFLLKELELKEIVELLEPLADTKGIS